MTRIYSLYAWIVGGTYFVLVLILTILLSFLIPQRRLDPVIKKMLRILFPLLCIRVEVEGENTIDPAQCYLFMANHVNILDIPLLGGFLPTFVRGVEAQRQFKWPLYGWAVRRVGNVSIDRTNIRASLRSLTRAGDLLKSGQSMVILPEGHRTLDGRLGPFKRLPFHLAKQVDIPIIPVGMDGLFRLKHKGSWLIQPGRIRLRIGPVISVETIREMNLEDLRDLARSEIQKLLAESGTR